MRVGRSDADESTPLVLLQLRTDVGGTGIVSLSADLAQTLIAQFAAAIAIVRRESPS
jgi:hypothetical protein